MKVLQVVHEFADYVKGAFITAEDEIKKVLGSHPQHVNAVELPADHEAVQAADKAD